ncbi:MAG: hypothetical protein O3A00_13905 [Planctomycetota bacterium]|nr:hypothetical protein [Planctomycetota bacterium]
MHSFSFLRHPLLAAEDTLGESVSDLGSTPYYVMVGYLVLLLVLGLFGWLKSKSGEEDYYLAGRSQGWMVSSLTIMATFFSSFALLGAPGLVYREGVVFALFSLNVPVAGLSVYLLGARIWKLGRKFGYVTPGDMVADYYGSKSSLRLLVAVAAVLYAIPYVVMQIQAGGLLSQDLFGEEYFDRGAIILAGITTLYIMIGGMRSVAWTDLIQGLLLIAGMLVSGFAMFLVFDGPGNFAEAITTELPESSLTVPGTTGLWTWPMLFTVCLLGSVGSMVQPAQWMRFYSAKDTKTLKRGALVFAAVLTTCFILGVMLIGLAGQVLYPLEYSAQETVAQKDGETLVDAGPQKLDQPVPEEFQEHFKFVPADPAKPGSTGQVTWKWSGKSKEFDAESTVTRLSALSDNAAYKAAVGKLPESITEGKRRPGVAPNPNVSEFDAILVTVLKKQLPARLGSFGALFASLIFVAIMAASMSTADSNLHAMSAVLTRDIYDQFIDKNASENRRVWVGRIVIMLATALALAAVIYGRNPEITAKYDFMKMIAKMGLMAIAFSAQLLPIAIDILFLRKGTGKGAAVGLAIGLLATFLMGPLFGILADATQISVLQDLVKTFGGLKFANMHGSVWGLVLNVPVFVLVSLVTAKPDPEKVRQYEEVLSR